MISLSGDVYVQGIQCSGCCLNTFPKIIRSKGNLTIVFYNYFFEVFDFLFKLNLN